MPEHDARTQEIEADAAEGAAAGSGGRASASAPELFTDGSRTAQLLEWADANRAERPAVLLAAQLAQGVPYAPHLQSEGQQAFVDEAIAAIGRSEARGNAARRWLLWLWDQAPDCIRSRLAGDQDIEAAERAIDMHRRAIAGEPITVSDWREARKHFRAAISADAFEPAVEAVVSSMWNLEAAPGAIADVASTWITESTLADAIRHLGWPDYVRVQAVWDSFAIEFSRIARRPGEGETEYNQRKHDYMRDNPPKISREEFARRKDVDDERLNIAIRQVDALRAGLLKILSE